MKYPSPFCFLFATLVCLTRAQDSNDGCITCYLGDLFGDYILPAAGRLFAPDLPSNPGAINPAPGLVEPQTDPEEQRSTDNVPSVTDQTDIELGIIGEPNPKCDPNAAGAKACAVGTAQIVWPSPFPCGDQVGTSKILASLNQLAPPGGVRSFHNKCGTWFFTASLTPQQIEQLMGENVGIEFIEPDQDATDDVESLSNFFGKRSLPKFEKLDRKSVARPWRMKKRVRIEPDFIRMTPDAPLHLAYISTPPGFANPDNVYASYHSDGKMVHVYWIGNNFHPQNADLGGYITAQHELRAEDIDLMEDDYDPRQPDIVGCLLSIVGGDMFGVLHGVDERLRDEQFEMELTNGLQLGFVKVHLRASSFLSGFQTILTELERRAASGDLFVHAYTVIGTSISIRDSRPSLQRRAAELIERLIQFGVVIVVAEGNELHPNRRRPSEDPNDGWPASFAFNPETPLILASGVSISNGIDMSPTPSPRQLLRAPWDATCMNGERVARIRGTPASAAIIVGLAADMLSREKVRTKLHLDFPDLEPEPERLLNLPVSAKIRNYLDEKSHDQRGSQPGIRSVWNGLDPRDPNIENYEA